MCVCECVCVLFTNFQVFYDMILQIYNALADTDREIQMYLAYRRGDVRQAGCDCYKAQPEEKNRRKTRLTGDDRRTGKNLRLVQRRPGQLFTVDDVGGHQAVRESLDKCEKIWRLCFLLSLLRHISFEERAR